MKIKGEREWMKFKAGQKLTPKQAIKAQCFVCNGGGEGAEDCGGKKSCPLYKFFGYRGVKHTDINDGFAALKDPFSNAA